MYKAEYETKISPESSIEKVPVYGTKTHRVKVDFSDCDFSEGDCIFYGAVKAWGIPKIKKDQLVNYEKVLSEAWYDNIEIERHKDDSVIIKWVEVNIDFEMENMVKITLECFYNDFPKAKFEFLE